MATHSSWPSPVAALKLAAILLAFRSWCASSSSSSVSAPDLPSSSEELLSRHRRFVYPLYTGWQSQFEINFRTLIPIAGGFPAFVRVALTLPFVTTYNRDTNNLTVQSVLRPWQVTRRRRSDTRVLLESKSRFSRHEADRYQMLGAIEQFMEEHLLDGGDGHDCMLKALCQVSQSPLHGDGFLGDVMNSLLTPSYLIDHLEHLEHPNEYLVAQRDGMVHDDCSAYEARCKLDIFQIDSIRDPTQFSEGLAQNSRVEVGGVRMGDAGGGEADRIDPFADEYSADNDGDWQNWA